MTPLSEFGKILIVFGLITLCIGCLFLMGARVPWLGRLPGDIAIEKKNVHFYFPLATCLLISLILSLLSILFSLFGKK